MKIKDITKKYGISRKALLVYEEKGLIHPYRNHLGYREYNQTDMNTISKIVFLRKLEFSLDEIDGLLSQNESNFIEKKKSEYEKDIHFIEIKKSYLEYVDKVIHDEYSSDEAIDAIEETLELTSQDSFQGIHAFEYHYEATFLLWLTSLVIAIFSMNTYLIIGSCVMGVIAVMICMKSVRTFFCRKDVQRIIGCAFLTSGLIGISLVVSRDDTLVHQGLIGLSLFTFLCGMLIIDKIRDFLKTYQKVISWICFVLGIIMMACGLMYEPNGLLGFLILQLAIIFIVTGIFMNHFLKKLIVYIFLELL